MVTIDLALEGLLTPILTLITSILTVVFGALSSMFIEISFF